MMAQYTYSTSNSWFHVERFIFHIPYSIFHMMVYLMENSKKESKYGIPLSNVVKPKPKKRLPQYDECLREFLNSGDTFWKVKIEALPSQDVKVIVSSFKWRVNNVDEFMKKGITVFLNKNQVYLQKERVNE